MHFSGYPSGNCLYLTTSPANCVLVSMFLNADLLEHRELLATRLCMRGKSPEWQAAPQQSRSSMNGSIGPRLCGN